MSLLQDLLLGRLANLPELRLSDTNPTMPALITAFVEPSWSGYSPVFLNGVERGMDPLGFAYMQGWGTFDYRGTDINPIIACLFVTTDYAGQTVFLSQVRLTDPSQGIIRPGLNSFQVLCRILMRP